jgi:hypothetical protein
MFFIARVPPIYVWGSSEPANPSPGGVSDDSPALTVLGESSTNVSSPEGTADSTTISPEKKAAASRGRRVRAHISTYMGSTFLEGANAFGFSRQPKIEPQARERNEGRKPALASDSEAESVCVSSAEAVSRLAAIPGIYEYR